MNHDRPKHELPSHADKKIKTAIIDHTANMTTINVGAAADSHISQNVVPKSAVRLIVASATVIDGQSPPVGQAEDIPDKAVPTGPAETAP